MSVETRVMGPASVVGKKRRRPDRQDSCWPLGVAAVDVDGVRERLEGVEGERERQHPRQDGEVLDRSDEPHVERDAERDQQAPQARRRGPVERPANQKVARGRGGDDGEIGEIPAGVEKVVGEKHHGQRAQPVSRGEPVGEENGREEAEIGRCSQQHVRMPQV